MEKLNGAIYNFFGHVFPDFGFPDKKMWYELKNLWPDANWDRGQVYDLYKWYQTGVKAGIPFYDVNQKNYEIFDWMKTQTGYTDKKINQWAAVFDTGIHDNWIEGLYVGGTGLAPEHEGTKIADTLNIKKHIAWVDRGTDKVLWILLAGGGLIVAYYGMPIVAKAFTFKKRK